MLPEFVARQFLLVRKECSRLHEAIRDLTGLGLGLVLDFVVAHGRPRHAERPLGGDPVWQGLDQVLVGPCVEEPRIRRHVGSVGLGARVVEMVEVPVVAALAGTHVFRSGNEVAAFVGEIRTGALGSPLIGMVVNRLSEVGVVIDDARTAGADDVALEGADHLRVAEVAAFLNVNIAAGEFERSVEFLQAAFDVLGAVDDKGGDDLDGTADGRSQEDQNRKGQVVFDDPLVPIGPGIVGVLEREYRLDGEQDGENEGRFVSVGREEEPQQGGADAEAEVGERVVDQRGEPAHVVLAALLKDGDFRRFFGWRTGSGGLPDVERQHHEARDKQQPAERSQDEEHLDALERIHEIVGERETIRLELAKHEALGDAGAPHGDDVEQNADETDPEVHVGEGLGPQLGLPQAGGQPVEHAGGHEAVPAERAGVNVADGPVGVVGKGVDLGDGHQRSLEGGHAVESDAGNEELDDRIGAELVPRAAEGEQAIEHAAP